jgi:hypothetical protein
MTGVMGQMKTIVSLTHRYSFGCVLTALAFATQAFAERIPMARERWQSESPQVEFLEHHGVLAMRLPHGFYVFDRSTGQRESLGINDCTAALRLLHARNKRLRKRHPSRRFNCSLARSARRKNRL